MRNIFLKKSYTKNVVEKTSPRHFSKKSKLNISMDQLSEISYSLFLSYDKGKGYKKNHKHVKEVGHTSEFLFDIY